MVGPDDKPLQGTVAWGVNPAFGSYELGQGLPRLPTATFEATGLDPSRPRYLLFWHKEKELAKAVLCGAETGPLTVKLESFGVVMGQLVDEIGKLRAGAKVYYSAADPPNDGGGFFRMLPAARYPGQAQDLVHARVTTDAAGKFKFRLVPGFRYDIGAQSDDDFLGWLAKDLTTPTDEPKDLGRLMLTTTKSSTRKP